MEHLQIIKKHNICTENIDCFFIEKYIKNKCCCEPFWHCVVFNALQRQFVDRMYIGKSQQFMFFSVNLTQTDCFLVRNNPRQGKVLVQIYTKIKLLFTEMEKVFLSQGRVQNLSYITLCEVFALCGFSICVRWTFF